MAFRGSTFLFDGISCHDYGLMLYSFGNFSQDDTITMTSTGSAMTDNTANRTSAFFYGVKQDRPLSFTLVFGADPLRMDSGKPLRRMEVARIADWLTGHSTMKWLTIVDSSMVIYRYKCYISELRLITYDAAPWAFSCTVTCDSPFAYMKEDSIPYEVSGTLEVDIFNPSALKGYYYPKLEITTTAQGDISIVNQSDNDRTFLLTGVPAETTVLVDGENQILTDVTGGLNLYAKFPGFTFLGLKPGHNELLFTGNFDITVTTSFPVNIGA